MLSFSYFNILYAKKNFIPLIVNFLKSLYDMNYIAQAKQEDVLLVYYEHQKEKKVRNAFRSPYRIYASHAL